MRKNQNNKRRSNGQDYKLSKSGKICASSNQIKLNHVEINKLTMPHKKIKYCPLISKILNKNNKKLKNPIIYSFLDFMNFFEKIQIRITCKQWNEIIKKQLPFLNQENFINCVVSKSTNYVGRDSLGNKKNIGVMGTYKKTNRKSLASITINTNTTNNSINNDQYNNLHAIENNNMSNMTSFGFENSDKKFSKKNVLVKLINSKNFNTIKNKVSLGEMTQSRNLMF
jgi:hypothetical protein